MGTQLWDLWFPQAGSTGLPFARAQVDADAVRGQVLVHAAPPELEVVVRDAAGQEVARGGGRRSEEGPMTRLVLDGTDVRLEDGWPTQDDLGRLVLLPGGEAGVLRAWEDAEDHSWWRWNLELFNHT